MNNLSGEGLDENNSDESFDADKIMSTIMKAQKEGAPKRTTSA